MRKSVGSAQTRSAECFESMKMAAQELEGTYYADRRPNPVTGTVSAIPILMWHGNGPWRQTRQKAVRSFETVLNLMDRYPEYRFMSSQPQLYEFVKEDAPGYLPESGNGSKRADGKRKEPCGREPDCNISSGESLIRHIIYGRRFFEQELGAEKMKYCGCRMSLLQCGAAADPAEIRDSLFYDHENRME